MNRRPRTAIVILAIFGAAVLLAGWVAPHDPNLQARGWAGSPPSSAFPFGTDEFGRDLFSRWLFGGRLSLAAGALGATLAAMIGLGAGLAAGYYGGWLDEMLMRLSELFQSLPWLYLVLLLRALLPLSLPSGTAFLLLVAIFGMAGWPRAARVVRGSTMILRESEYVAAARMMGARPAYILRVHLLPGVLQAARTQWAILFPQYVLAEVTLSMLGMGVQPPGVSWGSMLAELRSVETLSSRPWTVLPGLLLIPFFFALFRILERAPEERFPREV